MAKAIQTFFRNKVCLNLNLQVFRFQILFSIDAEMQADKNVMTTASLITSVAVNLIL